MTNEIERISEEMVVQAAGIQVVDQASANRATQMSLTVREAIKGIKARFAPHKEKARAAWQGLVDDEKAELQKAESVIKAIDGKISAWRAQENRKRQAAEVERLRIEREKRRLEEEALRKIKEAEEVAERERLRLECEAAELQKKEREALAAGDKATLAKVEEKREEIRQEAQAILDTVEKATDAAIDEAAKVEASMAPVPFVPEAPKTGGLRPKDNFSFEVEDKVALPEEFKIADQKALNAMARLKGESFKIPGGHVVNNPSEVAIGKRNGSSLN